MNFKPTKLKSIFTILIFLVVLFYNLSMSFTCDFIPYCASYQNLTPIEHCGCISLLTVLGDWLLMILPSIIYYLIHSMNQTKKVKK